MTISTNQTSAASSAWHMASFEDLLHYDANISGYRHNQGIAWNADAGEWISSWNYGLSRETEDFKFLQTTGSFDFATRITTSGIPKELADKGFDHIGDIDYYNGVIYASLDSKEHGYTDGQVALFNASDLSYIGVYAMVGAPSNPHNDVASWVAVDGANGLGYGKEWQTGNTINVYNLDDWSFKGTLEMDMSLHSIQGAKLFNGKIYMSANDDLNSIYSVELSTGHVEKLFDLPPTENASYETEGIALRQLADGSVEMVVEMLVNPTGDSNLDSYARIYHYNSGAATGPAPDLAHTFVISNTTDIVNPDNFSVSLREAIAKANAGDTITFDASLKGQTITLDSELVLSKDITINGDIDGDGNSDVTITRAGDNTAIHVTGGTATLTGLVVTHGDDTSASSIVVDTAGALEFANGATMTLGTDANDTIDGTSHWDAIQGGAGNDVIRGNAGNDLIYGGDGNDYLNGGADNDTLVGGAGADTMIGGKGDDVYFVDNKSDKVTEAAGEGTDTVHTSLNNYGLAANVENLVLEGNADLKVVGNDLDNTITGNDGDNFILAGAGNDTLFAGKGDDWLDGGIGADTFHGSAGNDTYVVDNKGDTIVDEAVNGGTDQIWSSIKLDLGKFANIENLRLSGTADIDATGNALDNLITGNAGDNDIAGGLGNDRLAGKGGADVFHFSDFGTANSDWINDFDSDDAIALDGDVFTGLGRSNGHLAAADFVRGAAATVAGEAAVIYNANTGMLSYDHDGKGGDAAQDIAFIGKKLDYFDQSDILVL
jgi:Ca2+-binding RTX toxin-like protein